MAIEIALTKGYVTIVDDEDADLAAFKWCARVTHDRVYAYRSFRCSGKSYTASLHRVVMERVLNCAMLSTQEVDHIDRDSLNNQRGNLRLATTTQNAQNRKVRKDSVSGFKGVSKVSSCKGWFAIITVNKARISIGTFQTKVDAAIAYNHAARQYFGEFAVFNDIPYWETTTPVHYTGKPPGVSGLKGVYLIDDKWIAQIQIKKSLIYLGSFDSELEAHTAYCMAAVKHQKHRAKFGAISPFKLKDIRQMMGNSN